MSDDEIRRLEAMWKSDVDKKLDKLLKFMELSVTRERDLSSSVAELNTILQAGKGGLTMLYLIAKVMGAAAVIAGGIYAVKKWIIS